MNVFEHAAALAYGTLFAIAPTLILAIAVSGLVFGNEAAAGRIFFQIKSLIGSDGANTIQEIIRQATVGEHDVWATIVGVVLFLLGATTVFAQLKGSLNDMWCVRPDPTVHELTYWFKVRLISLTMVICFCFILLVSLILSAALAAFGDHISKHLHTPVFVLQGLNLIFSTGVIAFLFAMIFKVLPDVQLFWKDVWVGGGVTAIFFAIGKFLITIYISSSSIATVYGAAGSLVVIMLWVYYSSLILFLGAAFTQVYTINRKRKVHPIRHAVRFRRELVVEEEG